MTQSTHATKVEISGLVSALGHKTREFEVQLKHLDDETALLKERWADDVLDPLRLEIDGLFNAIYVAATLAKKDLIGNSDKKSIELAAGSIGWRKTPAKVNVRNQDAVIAALRSAGLGNLVASAPSIDKEAVLRDPDAIAEIKGLTVTTGEQFWCKPLETNKETIKMVKKTATGGKRRSSK